jgi:hypothetical protein
MVFTEFLASRRKLMAAVTREAFEELSAKSYEAVYPAVSPDTFVAELADAASEQQVTVLDLIDAGLLTVGSILIPAGGSDAVAEVDADGTILLDDVSYPTPSAAGKAAAGTNVNGWKYWIVDAPAGERLLDAIRSEYRLANVADSDDEASE